MLWNFSQHASLFFFYPFKLSDIPVLTLEFGTNQQSHSTGIREGADVYFECNIKANPPVYKVSWKQNVSNVIQCEIQLLRFYENLIFIDCKIFHEHNNEKSRKFRDQTFIVSNSKFHQNQTIVLNFNLTYNARKFS